MLSGLVSKNQQANKAASIDLPQLCADSTIVGRLVNTDLSTFIWSGVNLYPRYLAYSTISVGM